MQYIYIYISYVIYHIYYKRETIGFTAKSMGPAMRNSMNKPENWKRIIVVRLRRVVIADAAKSHPAIRVQLAADISLAQSASACAARAAARNERTATM